MAISDRLNKLTTDITNAYTSIENKGGTIPANKNTNNLPTAINSIEVIESATAEGESLSLTNTKAMPYSDYVVEGKSKQTTRSGKNKFNYASASDTNNTTVTEYRIFEIGGLTPNSQYNINNMSFVSAINEYVYLWDTPNYSSQNKYFIAHANYSNKIGFYSNSQGKIYLAIYPTDTTSWNNIMPYLENAQIEEGNTQTDYEPYGASPSPDYPSEIHSVADDVNLLNLENIENHSVNSYYYENIGTDFQLKAGETYTLSFDAESDITPFNVGIGCGSSGNYQSDILVKDGFQNGRISITFTPQNSNFTYGNYLTLRFVRYNSSTSYTYSARNIKLQKGTTATPYSPYNQGTLTIKQRGKNLFNANANTKQTIQVSNDGATITLNTSSLGGGAVNGDKLSVLAPDLVVGETYKLSLSSSNSSLQYIYVGSLWVSGTTKTITQAMLDATTVFYSTSNEQVTITNMQIVKENDDITAWEPYRVNNYTFQTAPLRSLPNGVKDTIEADGIHGRVRKTVLNENNINIVTNFGYRNNMPRVYILKTDLGFKNGWEKNVCLMNKYKQIDSVSSLATGTFATNFIQAYVEIFNENFTDLETARQILLGTEIIYQLAEEIIEPLTQNQATTMLDIIKTGSYEGTTNIYTDEDVKPTIGVDYYKKA